MDSFKNIAEIRPKKKCNEKRQFSLTVDVMCIELQLPEHTKSVYPKRKIVQKIKIKVCVCVRSPNHAYMAV